MRKSFRKNCPSNACSFNHHPQPERMAKCPSRSVRLSRRRSAPRMRRFRSGEIIAPLGDRNFPFKAQCFPPPAAAPRACAKRQPSGTIKIVWRRYHGRKIAAITSAHKCFRDSSANGWRVRREASAVGGSAGVPGWAALPHQFCIVNDWAEMR